MDPAFRGFAETRTRQSGASANAVRCGVRVQFRVGLRLRGVFGVDARQLLDPRYIIGSECRAVVVQRVVDALQQPSRFLGMIEVTVALVVLCVLQRRAPCGQRLVGDFLNHARRPTGPAVLAPGPS